MIYYTYRITEDWENKKDFTYRWTSKNDEFLKNVNFISLWNSIFEIKWNQFRGRMKQVSQKYFKLLDVPEISNKSWADLNDDDWLIFIDDDDMVSKHLLNAIKNNDDKGFIYGDVSYFNLHNHSYSFEIQKDHITSCGYAFKIKYLKLLDKDTIYSIFNYHWNLRRDVMNNNIPSYCHNKICSCYTCDWSSVSQMVRPEIYDKFFIEKSLEYNGEPKYLPNYLEWARPFLVDMCDLVYKTNQSKIRR